MRKNVYDVTDIKVEKLLRSNALIVVALNKNTPRLIFPRVLTDYRESTLHDKDVAFTLDKIVITVEFHNSTDAKEFYDFFKFSHRY